MFSNSNNVFGGFASFSNSGNSVTTAESSSATTSSQSIFRQSTFTYGASDQISGFGQSPMTGLQPNYSNQTSNPATGLFSQNKQTTTFGDLSKKSSFGSGPSTVFGYQGPDKDPGVSATSDGGRFMKNTVFGSNGSKTSLSQKVFGSPSGHVTTSSSFELFQNNTTANVFASPLSATANPFRGFSGSTSSIFGHSAGSSAATTTTVNVFSRPINSQSSGSMSGKSFTVQQTSRLDGEAGRASRLMGRLAKRKVAPPTVASPHKAEDVVKLDISNVPEQCNSKHFLYSHFNRFGNVLKVIPNANVGTADVYFDSHESARNAKENGRILEPGARPVDIVLKVPVRGRPSAQTAISLNRRLQTGLEKPETGHKFGAISDGATAGGFAKSITNATGSDYDAGRVDEQRMHRNDDDVDDIDEESAVLEGSHAAYSSRGKHSERPSSPQVAVKSQDLPSFKSLSAAKASNSDERFRILEQRDRMIRAMSTSQKSTDLSDSIARRGTCPDMCPEKERYMREGRRRLSAYEIVPGTDVPGQNPQVDHFRAVKEYSRSSADQEVPLPSELRPPHVLNVTMNYLLTNIMDRGGPGLWAEWYDFLWNRMRSIRKDITQQMLCDLTSVELVEKSARFHVLCSEMLCEEDPSTFDQKINSENLTKCLQTLKELYHDLEGDHGVVCPNEAEFRSYMILMNLNSGGDILREGQHWRKEVRQSAAFKRSMAIYSSVNSNNYVKFFKLVQKASYLESCILHRYFNQIRSVALQRIGKSFSSPASVNVISYPFPELMNRLGFETAEDAEVFLSHSGLTVTNDVILSDSKSCQSLESENTSLPLRRSYRLVGSKAASSLGEIVNGGPLSSVSLNPPENSFDSHGGLLQADLENVANDFRVPDVPDGSTALKSFGVNNNSSGQFKKDASSFAFKNEVAAQQSFSSNKIHIYPQLLNEVPFQKMCIDMLKGLFMEVIEAMVVDLCKEVVEDFHRYQLVTSLCGDVLIRELVDASIRSCCQEVVAEFKQKKLDREAMMTMSDELAFRLVEDVVQSEVQKLCSEVFQFKWMKEMESSREASMLELMNEIVTETATRESMALCVGYHRSNVEGVLCGMEEFRVNLSDQLLKKYWNKWLGCLKRKRLNRLLPSTVNLHQNFIQLFQSMFPRNSPNSIPGSNFLSLDGDIGISLQTIDRVIIDQDNLKERLKNEESALIEERKYCWSPVDVFRLVEEKLREEPGLTELFGKKSFWKLAISLPECGPVLSYELGLFVKWLNRKFKMDENATDIKDNRVNLLHSKTIEIPDINDKPNSFTVLSVSIKSTTGAESGDVMFGSSAIIFFLRDWRTGDNDDELFQLELERLDSLLSCKPDRPALPLVVVGRSKTRSFWTSDYIAGQLRLEEMVSKSQLSCFKVILNEDMAVNSLETSHRIEESIKWLLENIPSPPRLQCKPMVDFFEENISRCFHQPVLNNLKRRKEKDYSDLPMNDLIEYYNEVVNWLISVITQSELSSLSWPASEFSALYEDLPAPDWNNPEKLKDVRRGLSRLLPLPKFKEPTCGKIPNWKESCSSVWMYIQDVIRDAHSPSKLVAKINNLLEKTATEAVGRRKCRKLKETVLLNTSQLNWEIIPRTSIIMACIDFQLSRLIHVQNFGDQHKPVQAVYFPNLVSEDEIPLQHRFKNLMEIKASGEKGNKRKYACGYCMNCMDDVDQERENRSPTLSSARKDLKSSCDKSESNESVADFLFDFVASEKEASKSFEEYLEKTLQEQGGSRPSPLDCSVFDADAKRTKMTFVADDRRPSVPVGSLQTKGLFTAELGTKSPRRLGPNVESDKLEANFDLLKFRIEQEKRADATFEMRLKSLINEDVNFNN